MLACLPVAHSQTQPHEIPYANRNSFGIFGAYSPDSSHILLGEARNRMLVNIGANYERRLLLNRIAGLRYSAEFAPIAVESDPVQTLQLTITNTNPPATINDSITLPSVAACKPGSGTSTVPGVGVETYSSTCSRRWTMGEAFSPAGLRLSLFPERKLQPFIVGHGGYMYSSNEIPIAGAGSFNFTFDAGIGLEFFHSRSRAIRLEYRYHHISNSNTATLNPGIDNGLIQFTYSLGWGR
jgi:Lipid A 3-O-deacylase (PagL).